MAGSGALPDICSIGWTIGDSYVPFDPDDGDETCDDEEVYCSQAWVRLTDVTPINQEADSIDQLNRITDKLQNVCSYVVLRNTVHSDSFPLFENTVIRKRLLKELGAKEITMSKLQPWLVEELSHSNLTITSAVADGRLHLLDRQRLQTWQRKLYGQIESVTDLLLPIKS